MSRNRGNVIDLLTGNNSATTPPPLRSGKISATTPPPPPPLNAVGFRSSGEVTKMYRVAPPKKNPGYAVEESYLSDSQCGQFRNITGRLGCLILFMAMPG